MAHFNYYPPPPPPPTSRDLERVEVPVYSVKAHSEIINAIDAIGGLGIGGGAPEIVTGSRDGEFTTTLQRQSPTSSCV